MSEFSRYQIGLRSDAVCYSCSVLGCCSVLLGITFVCDLLQCVEVCCRNLQCVTRYNITLRSVAVCCRVLQFII